MGAGLTTRLPSTSTFLVKHAGKFWPPFIGAGVRVTELSPDYKEMQTKMKLHWYTMNPMRTHFGGNLYSMTDPFYTLMLLHHIGNDHYIWDKSARIDFVHPSKTEVRADFRLTDDVIEDVVEKAKDGEATYRDFEVDVLDTEDRLVAKVIKTVYIRRKPKMR